MVGVTIGPTRWQPVQFALLALIFVVSFSQAQNSLAERQAYSSSKKMDLTPQIQVGEPAGEEQVDFDYQAPRPPEGSLISTFFRAVISLGVITVLIYLSVYGLRFFYRSSRLPIKPGGAICLLETFPLSTQRTLYLLSCGSKVLLVAFTEKSVCKLDEWTETEFKQATSQPSVFARQLEGFARKLEEEETSSPVEQLEQRIKKLWKKRTET